jgi:DNA (cytosine-5)-methyltransferase 1
MISEQSRNRSTATSSIIDLFAGPGGLDVAASWLGIAAHGIEWDPDACSTRRAAGLATTFGDVRHFGPEDFPQATVLAGGPPCQTFTVAGTGAGRRALDTVLELVKSMASGDDVRDTLAAIDDERTGLVLEPLRWALEAKDLGKPYEAIVLEQVPAVLPVWAAIGEALEAIGYKVDCGILHTEQYGVPQTRRRAILVARADRAPTLPRPTHRNFRPGIPRDEGSAELRPWVSMEMALDRTGPFTVVSNYGSNGDPKARGRRRSCEPAATITGKVRRNRLTGPGALIDDRFTLSEAGRLQTFPADYPWSGRDIAQQIGNAMPPRLAAYVIAAALGMSLDEAALDEAVSGSWRIQSTIRENLPALEPENASAHKNGVPAAGCGRIAPHPSVMLGGNPAPKACDHV